MIKRIFNKKAVSNSNNNNNSSGQNVGGKGEISEAVEVNPGAINQTNNGTLIPIQIQQVPLQAQPPSPPLPSQNPHQSHNSILNRIKIQFESVVSLKPSSSSSSSSTASSSLNNTSQAIKPDTETTLTNQNQQQQTPQQAQEECNDENQKTMTKLDGLLLLEQLKLNDESEKIESKLNEVYNKTEHGNCTDDEIKSVLFKLPDSSIIAQKGEKQPSSNNNVDLSWSSSSSLCSNSSPIIVTNNEPDNNSSNASPSITLSTNSAK